jgi:peroxiredoxin
LQAAIADPFAGESVDVWLIDVEDSFEQSYAWIGDAGVTLPVLLDLDRALYDSYSPQESGESHSPFPVHVVVDGQGVITYLARDNQPEAVRAAIQTALDEL